VFSQAPDLRNLNSRPPRIARRSDVGFPDVVPGHERDEYHHAEAIEHCFGEITGQQSLTPQWEAERDDPYRFPNKLEDQDREHL
jgi:hypothetical protein